MKDLIVLKVEKTCYSDDGHPHLLTPSTSEEITSLVLSDISEKFHDIPRV